MRRHTIYVEKNILHQYIVSVEESKSIGMRGRTVIVVVLFYAHIIHIPELKCVCKYNVLNAQFLSASLCVLWKYMFRVRSHKRYSAF